MATKGPDWDLDQLLREKVFVALTDEREVTGILRGFDDVGNLVLEGCQELAPWGGTCPEGYQLRTFAPAVIRSKQILAINLADSTTV
jgi:small nuclear ribonucleoprotein (snRNP)-like protein